MDKIRELVCANARFLKTAYVDGLQPTEHGLFIWSNTDYEETNHFWNHLIPHIDTTSTAAACRAAEDFYSAKSTTPSVYVPTTDSVDAPPGYTNTFTDAWMVEDSHEYDHRLDVTLQEVTSRDEMETFVELFYRTHAGDLDDPYAGLSEAYGDQLLSKFNQNSEEDISRENYLIIYDGEPVGHRIIFTDDEYACLSTLGVLPEIRGNGIGSQAVGESVRLLNTRGIETIFLQTESGSQNESFFKHQGFETRFRGECFTKQ